MLSSASGGDEAPSSLFSSSLERNVSTKASTIDASIPRPHPSTRGLLKPRHSIALSRRLSKEAFTFRSSIVLSHRLSNASLSFSQLEDSDASLSINRVNNLVLHELTRHRTLTDTTGRAPTRKASSVFLAARKASSVLLGDAQDDIDPLPLLRREKIVDWFKNSPDHDDEVVPRYVLHPESHGRTGWDIFTGIQVVIICFLLPFEICYMDSQNIPTPNWWTMLQDAMTYTFMVDLFVNFFTAYRVRSHSPLISDFRMIARRYSKTWFVPDFLAAFPYQLLDSNSTSGNKLTLGKMGRFSRFARLIRLARLLRLVKLPRLFQLVQRLEHRFNVHPGLARMNRILLSVILGVHLACCVWFVIGRSIQYQGFPQFWPDGSLYGLHGSWISQFGYAYGVHQNQTFNLERQYIASFYYCMTTLATVGYGDISGKTYAEQIFAMGLMIFGVVWYSFVLSSTASIIHSFRGHEHKMHARLREVNEFLKDAKVDRNLSSRIREHFQALARRKDIFSYTKEYDAREVLRGLSNELKTEVIVEIQQRIISQVPYLDGKSKQFQASFLVHLESLIIGANDFIIEQGMIIEKLKFLTKGKAIALVDKKYLGIFDEGDCIGEAALLRNGLQQMSVFALIPCHIEAISYEVLSNLTRFYAPEVDELVAMAVKEQQLILDFRKAPTNIKRGIRRTRSVRNLVDLDIPKEFADCPYRKVSSMHEYLTQSQKQPEDKQLDLVKQSSFTETTEKIGNFIRQCQMPAMPSVNEIFRQMSFKKKSAKFQASSNSSKGPGIIQESSLKGRGVLRESSFKGNAPYQRPGNLTRQFSVSKQIASAVSSKYSSKEYMQILDEEETFLAARNTSSLMSSPEHPSESSRSSSSRISVPQALQRNSMEKKTHSMHNPSKDAVRPQSIGTSTEKRGRLSFQSRDRIPLDQDLCTLVEKMAEERAHSLVQLLGEKILQLKKK